MSYNKIDKSNEFVNYNDEEHKYWTKEGELLCTSVTTVVKAFENFDKEFWLSYKALERIIPEEFKSIKKLLLKSKVFNEHYLKLYDVDKEEFLDVRNTIEQEWAAKAKKATDRGLKIHKQFEDGHMVGKTKELKTLGLGGKFKTDTSNKIQPGKGIYPELLLSRISEDKELRLAGQADLIIVDGYDVYVIDYKTSEKIETSSYFDSNARKKVTMKYPLTNIEDSNFWHYTMQLSTYAWMIEKINPKFNIKKLIIIHIDHSNNVKEYECEYRKKEVERMLGYFKKQLSYNKFKEKRSKTLWDR
jgi:hypothetical protein